MAFLDEVGKKITDASQSTLQMTKNIADVAKCNSTIADEEKKIKENYYLIGKAYFEKMSEAPDEEFAVFVDEIKKSNTVIEDMKNRITALKGMGKCPNCGAEIDEDSAFCSMCGTKIEREEKQETTCASCGKPVKPGNAFCIYCGTKVQ